MNSKHTGRKPKFTPEIVTAICDCIANGLTDKDAATICDVSAQTLSTWKKQHPEFAEHLKKARQQFKQHHINNIIKASEKTWQASAWLLERIFREEFSLRQEVTGAEGKPIVINFVPAKQKVE